MRKEPWLQPLPLQSCQPGQQSPGAEGWPAAGLQRPGAGVLKEGPRGSQPCLSAEMSLVVAENSFHQYSLLADLSLCFLVLRFAMD